MSSDTDLVVLTCASGQQCARLTPLLYDRYPLRLVVNSESSESRLKPLYPKASVTRADLAEPSECRRIIRDAVVVYHVGPSLHPREMEIGLNMVEACERESKQGRFKHFVFSSVLNTQFRKMFNHDRKRYVEEALFESGLNYTVLKPSDFMDWAIPVRSMFGSTGEGNPWGGMLADGSAKWVLPWSAETPSSLTSLADLAEASAKVIEEREKHYLAEYPLTSTVPINRAEAAKLIEGVTGRKVVVSEPENYEAAVAYLMSFLHGDAAGPLHRDGVERIVLFYMRRGLRGNANVMRWLLGREPTSLEGYIRLEAKALGL